MKKQKFFTFILTLFTSISLKASHCMYLDAKSATQVFEELREYKGESEWAIIDQYCRSCGDTYIRPIVLENLEYRPYQVKGFASILINGKEMDFAYLYLRGENIGAKHNCKTSGASENLFTSK